jgi:CRISPR-associated endonuclease/helicase Cas3
MDAVPGYVRGYWGKASREESENAALWHPLAYHSLDVAAVADLLLQKSPRRLERMAALLGVDPASLKPLLVLLVALHDVGKLAPDFQAKSVLGPAGASLGLPRPGVRHDAIGYDLLQGEHWPAFERVLARYVHGDGGPLKVRCFPLWSAVTGHHGEPAMNTGRYGFGTAEQKALSEMLDAVAALLPPCGEPLSFNGKQANRLSWLLAGLTNVADWIGSNQSWFPYHDPKLSLADYWLVARKQAAIALDECGILPSPSPSSVSAPDLLAHLTGELSPLQKAALTCEIPNGPVLAVIEDVTGSGKTEAALLIAARLMAARRATGLFFGLPTMATANAMYERLSVSYRRLFEDAATPSLVLAHGKRALHEGFRHSILEATVHDGVPAEASGRAKPETPADLSASAACMAWIADDRRKAFLADVGVGTIDQAILGVLPSRFQVLRLWGLAERVLIVDEAHSFDSYLSRELETLLEFHAALGGSAIVLSATLSTEARGRIVAAYQRGLGIEREPKAVSAYPLLTLIGADEERHEEVGARAELARDLAVRRIATTGEAVRHVVELSRRGATVAWIRNAVDDCIEAHMMLREAGLEPMLIHARFAMGDRLAIEAEVQRRLGRNSTPDTRRNPDGTGVVIVGSQILEQSLDCDVDAMVTDLAPVDMIIQRAGRLWRHPWRNQNRPIGVGERALMLLTPDPEEVQDKNWYLALSKRSAFVYPDHGYIWRSAKALLERGLIRTPSELRSLLAAVYDETVAPAVPPTLERASLKADGQRTAARSVAANNSLEVGRGYGGNNQLFEADTITPTRLGEQVTVFRLARREAGRIVPLHPLADAGESLARAWALSECAVRTHTASGVPAPSGAFAAEVATAKADWPKWEQEQPLLLLEPGVDGVWRARVVAGDKGEREVLYDRVLGWRMSKA